jgi:hypothetical protein
MRGLLYPPVSPAVIHISAFQAVNFPFLRIHQDWFVSAFQAVSFTKIAGVYLI